MNNRWTMSFQEWGRRVDALVIELASGLLYALRGRTSEIEYKREQVPPEHFRQPHWESIQGFVVVYDQGDDRQGRASYMPVSIESVQPGRHIVPSNREVYYDRDDAGAQRAASEIAAFLQEGTLPPRREDP